MIGNKMWVVMEYMDGGCLTDILEEYNAVPLTEQQIAYFSREARFCSLYSHFLGIHPKKEGNALTHAPHWHLYGLLSASFTERFVSTFV